MLRKYSNTRSLSDNIKLGSLTAFSAGMVNAASWLIFTSFSSNVTGYYAILSSDIASGDTFSSGVVLTWISLFFIGSFLSNFIVIHFRKYTYIAHATPILLELCCLLFVGGYGQYFYQQTEMETNFLIGLLLFAMGLQNGLTASISNFSVKTTHLTGSTTDLAILCSMFTKKEFRKNIDLIGKAKVIGVVFLSWIVGGVSSGLLYFHIGFRVFYIVCLVLVVVILYDYYKLLRVKQTKRFFNFFT